MDKLAICNEAPYLQTLAIDVAGLGGKMMCLPGEALQSVIMIDGRVGDGASDCKESAEVIVPRYARRRVSGRTEQQPSSLK